MSGTGIIKTNQTTMKTINIGTVAGGGSLHLDIPILLKTRLLIQANSGGGKSWLIRRLAEQLFGKVPVIIIDPEGEFATLREKFGYVLVGKGGETPADLRSASIVAHKLLELRASAVCDLYELKPQTRHQWVRLFIDALIDAPKEFWRPTVIIVDEAHQYAPEGKSGESEASGAMVDLATRGRKRGYCAIFATQRLGKLRKDAAAELLNVMVGMTFIDIDRERAAECLGVSREEKHAFYDEIKLLTEGKFYCLGRAIAKERTMVKVGSVETTHPEAGGGKFSNDPPPAPDAIKGMLPKLADLPKAAEEKAKTEADLRKEITALKRELSQRPTPETKTETVSVLTAEDRNIINETLGLFEGMQQSAFTSMQWAEHCHKELKLLSTRISGSNKIGPARVPTVRPVSARPAPVPRSNNNSECHTIGGGMKRMLITLAQRSPLTDRQLGVRAGMSSGSGTFGTYLATLRQAGYITGDRNALTITNDGITALGHYDPLPEGMELLDYWLGKLDGGASRMLRALAVSYPHAMTDEELGAAAEISSASGTFGTYLSTLRTLELITGKRDALKASEEFFQ